MENAPPPTTVRARFAACRVCLAVGLLASLATVGYGVTMTWLVPPDLPAAVARLRASSEAPSPEILVAVERNRWTVEDGRGPLLLGGAALWAAALGAAVGLLACLRARGSPPRRPVALAAAVLWLVAAGLVGATLRLYRHAHLDAATPWGAQAGTVTYHVERDARPRADARVSERVRLGPLAWGPGIFVTLAGTLAGAGLLVLAAPRRGRTGEEAAAREP